MLERIEASYKTTELPQEQRWTVLSEAKLRKYEQFDAEVAPLVPEHPEYIREAKELMLDTHANELKQIWCLKFMEEMIRELGPVVSRKRPNRWRWAMNVVCNAYGVWFGNYDTLGKPVKNMPLAAVTWLRLKTLKKILPRKTARQLFPLLRRVLAYAVEEHYLRVNPTDDIEFPTLRAEIKAKADEEIAIDSPAQVQIAFNVAAAYRNSYFLPHVALMYQPHLRPEGELPQVKPNQVYLAEKLIRIHSIKVNAKRLAYLSESTAAILTEMWDGRRLQFDGWEKFQSIMRAAQGYDVGGVPKWFAEQLPPPWMFSLWQISNLASFAKKLSAKANPVFAFIRTRMGDSIDSSLRKYCATGENARELQALLIDGLNGIVMGPSLAGNAAFAGIDLSPETIELQKQNPADIDLQRLNRMLLADACAELSRIPQFVPDLPRHTGRSIYVHCEEWMRVTYRGDDDRRVLQTHYDALITKRQAAQTLALLPASMTMTPERRAAILEELVKHKLVTDGKFPEPPIVPAFILERPAKKFWVPPVSDEELVKTMFKIGTTATAKKFGTSRNWLLAVCAARGLRVPPSGRYHTDNPEDVPTPPPLVALSNTDLEAKLKELHGIQPTAQELGIDPPALTAYCYLHGIATPSQRELGTWRGKAPRVKLGPQQIKVLLGRDQGIEQIAQQAGTDVTVDHLRRYCHARGIEIPTEPPAKHPATDLEALKALVARDLAGRNGSKMEASDALDTVLSHVPRGLPDSDIIAVLEANGILITSKTIRSVINSEAKGHFARFDGRVHLLRHDTDVDLNKLQAEVKQEAQNKKDWGQLDAIRCLLARAQRGLSIQQLSTALSWFGIQIEPQPLLKEVRRYVNQVRLQLYRGTVTLPETAPSFTMRVAEKEPTPQLAEIQAAVGEKYAALIDKKFTNVEIMEFVLSHAPQGLWTDEFLAIAKSLGIDFKEWCIHSVVVKEAKGRFRRNNGRLSLVKPVAPRVTLRDIKTALDGQINPAETAATTDLMLDILRCFPGGLTLNEWFAATCLADLQEEFKPFRARAYYLAEEGRCVITKLRATVAPPAPPVPDLAGGAPSRLPEPSAALSGPR